MTDGTGKTETVPSAALVFGGRSAYATALALVGKPIFHALSLYKARAKCRRHGGVAEQNPSKE